MGKKLIFIFCFFSIFLSSQASELRVSQLGKLWLVSDEYGDIIQNNARIMKLSKNILAGRLDISASGNDDNTQNYGHFGAYPKLSFFGIFDVFNAGLISETFIYDPFYPEFGMDESLSFFAGMKASDTLSFGLGVHCNIYSIFDNSLFAHPSSFHALSFSADFDDGNIDVGVSLYGGTEFTEEPRAMATLSLLSGFHLQDGASMRVFNRINYSDDDFTSYYDYWRTNYYGDLYNVGTCVSNNSGVSYEGKYGTVNYILGLSNDWIIKNKSSFETTGFYREKTITGDTANLFVSFEMPVFVEWFILRISYSPLVYINTERKERYQNKSTLIIEEHRFLTNHLEFFPLTSGKIGVEIKVGENSSVDIGVKSDGFGVMNLYSYTGTIDGMPTTPMKDNEFDMSLSAEFTMKW